MELSEKNLLLEHTRTKPATNKLSILFGIICVIDVFGVFPVIALPKAIIDCGFYGLLVIAVVCTIQVYTSILLGKCWILAEKIDATIKDKNRYPYSALAEMTYGTTFSNCVSLLVNVTIFCGGIPNLIVASQNLQLLGLRLSDDAFNVSFCFWIIAIGVTLCPVLWLGSPKDMKFLCSLSVCLVIIVFILVCGCLIFSPSQPSLPQDSDLPIWELIFISYGIISFQFDIHPSVLTIQLDMQDKSKIKHVIFGGFALSLGMFSIVTTIAAIKFGSATQPSLLETLQTTVPLHFAAFFVALQLCLSLAVSNSALFQYMEDCMRIPRAFNQRRCILRTMLTFLAILIAESVPRFDLVMSLIGGTLTGPLVFMLPPMFYLKMVAMERKHTKQLAMETFTASVYQTEEETTPVPYLLEDGQRVKIFDTILCVAIVSISVLCTVLTTYINLKNAVIFTNFTQPCIVNISAALVNF